MNNMNSPASKMSKSQVIQLIDQKIDDFLDLATSIHNQSVASNFYKPVLAGLTLGLSIGLWRYDFKVLGKEKFVNLFIETINTISIISVDEALRFILDATSIDSERDSLFVALKHTIHEKNDPYITQSYTYNSLLANIALHFIDPHYESKDRWMAHLMDVDSEARIRYFAEQLKIYRNKISQQWKDDPEYTFQIQKGEFVMKGDSYSVGNITNANVSGFVLGEHNRVVASLNAAGQPELVQALSTLTQAVLASQDLPTDKKEEQVKIINQIGKEAAEPKPNKTLLKILVDGLLATLKAVPDVASAVTAVMPILSQLHL